MSDKYYDIFKEADIVFGFSYDQNNEKKLQSAYIMIRHHNEENPEFPLDEMAGWWEAEDVDQAYIAWAEMKRAYQQKLVAHCLKQQELLSTFPPWTPNEG
jgi:hypothetical protein